MKTKTLLTPGRIIVLLSLSFVTAAGQTTPASPPRADANDTVQLSPFEVSTTKDTGYIAADTLSAGRLATNLLMTPGDFDVMTRDLLNDLAVFNIDEASGWLTNARPMEVGQIEGNSMNPASLAMTDSGTNVNLRGLGANPSTRNYFLSANTPKEYNVERAESARGPNAILYGEGGPGGGINYMTKRAQNRNFTTLRYRADTFWSQGVSVDVNRRLSRDLDVRYNGMLLNQRGFISRTRTRTTGNALNVLYRPFERTTVTVDADVSVGSRPGYVMQYAEQYSQWNKVAVTAKPTSAQATAAGLNLWAANTKVYVDGFGAMNFGGMAYTKGPGLLLENEYENASLFPGVQAPPSRGFNANPSQVAVEEHASDYQVAVDHQFRNGLSVQVAGEYAKYRSKGGNYLFGGAYLDPNTFMPNGQANPNFGKPFSWSYAGRQVQGQRDSKAVRAVAAYPLRLWRTTTNFSAFAQRQEQYSRTVYTDQQVARADDLGIVDPSTTGAVPITDGTRRIYVYRYWDNLPSALPEFRKMYDVRDVPSSDGITKQIQDAFEVAASGRYLHDSLQIVAGFRRDRSYLATANGDTASRDRLYGQFGTYTTDNRVAFNNTTTAGLVYFPLKWIGVYGNHAEGFTVQTVSSPKLDGSFSKANIVPAYDNSVGLRFNIVNDRSLRVVGSLGYYYANQSNSAFSIGVGNINGLWNDLGKRDQYIHTFDVNPLGTASSNSITSQRSLLGWGYEASVTANYGNSLRVTVNGALPHTKQWAVGSDYVSYITAHLPEWQTLITNRGPNFTNDSLWVGQVQTNITGFQDGRSQNNTYKYRYNIFGVYSFSRSEVKGLRVGGGVQIFGPWIIGNVAGNAYDYIYSKSYYVATANLGYGFKWRKVAWDFQLNVDNLFSYDKEIINGLFTLAGTTTQIPYGSKFRAPRSLRLTTTVSF